MITLELFEMKLMRTLKWLIAILIMQMKCRTSLMRNHEALSLGRSYPDSLVFIFWQNGVIQNYKKTNCHTFKIRNSRALGGTSRVVLELKPFGISIRGTNGSQPWVGRSTAQMSGNPSGQCPCNHLPVG